MATPTNGALWRITFLPADEQMVCDGLVTWERVKAPSPPLRGRGEGV
jgi:hypothetical protein